jgi:hypothetical protein
VVQRLGLAAADSIPERRLLADLPVFSRRRLPETPCRAARTIRPVKLWLAAIVSGVGLGLLAAACVEKVLGRILRRR